MSDSFGLTADFVKRAFDDFEDLHKHDDQNWATLCIRSELRALNLVVIRTQTTAELLEFDLRLSGPRYTEWKLPDGRVVARTKP